MKKKLKLYIETTLFNYFFDEDRDAHVDTVRLFKEIKAGKYEAYTSTAVTDELMAAPNPKRDLMMALAHEYNIKILPVDNDAKLLAETYIERNIVPAKCRMDATHIAVASVNKLDVIITMNFRHLVNPKTKTMTNAVNIVKNYTSINIISPLETVKLYENSQHN